MSKSQGDLESGLTKFLRALYACFRCMSRFLVCFQFCECPSFAKRGKKPRETQADDVPRKRDNTNEKHGLGIFSFPKRYILAIMTFLGFLNMYALRVNLNVAIEAMVNNHTIQQKGITAVREAEFHWNSKLQGIVLGSFYYGYAFLQLPGGCLALKLGGTRIFGYAIFMASLLTLLTPVATRCSVYGLIILRVAEGLVLGAVFPCNHAIWSKWAPKLERTTLVTIAISGCHVGTIITMPLSGLLTKYGFDGGWASVFYCFGAAGILWFVAWQLIVHETPSAHPTITEEEKLLIENGLEVADEDAGIPWKSIFTSVPVWGIIFGHLAADWGLYTILICLPMFLLDILHFDIQTMGFLAATPFLVKSLSGPFGGITADFLRRRSMTTQAVRRLYFSIGAIGAGTFIVAAGYAKSASVAVTCMCIGVAASGLMHSGYNVNMLDIAPNYACVIMGLSNTVGTFAGFLSPMMVGYVTQNKKAEEWQTVFWVTFAIYVVGMFLFCLLMSGEQQPWAGGRTSSPPDDDDDEEEEEEEEIKLHEES